MREMPIHTARKAAAKKTSAARVARKPAAKAARPGANTKAGARKAAPAKVVRAAIAPKVKPARAATRPVAKMPDKKAAPAREARRTAKPTEPKVDREATGVEAATPSRAVASKPVAGPTPRAEPAPPSRLPDSKPRAEPTPSPESPAVVAPIPAAEAPAPPPKRRHARPKLGAWAPREVPAPRVGKPGDPRLAAAIAARERWHGRSGRPALKSATQAVAFARERRLVQLLEPTPLPNLFDPIIGKSCSSGERLEGPAAAVFRGWRREFGVAHDLLDLRLAFERPTLVQAELWPSLVTVAEPREAAARSGALPLPREAEEALEILDRKGIVPVERLGALLGLAPDEMTHLSGLLESNLLVLARGEIDEEDGPITVLETIGRWAIRAVGPRRLELHQAFTLLFAAALRAAAVLWPDEIAALLPWSAAERDAAVAACLAAGAVVTYDEGGSVAYVASPVPR